MATDLISDLSDTQTRFIKNSQHPLVLGLDQIDDDLVVEVVDVLPLDALALVLLLLLLENQFNEQLLQLLVTVVDAQLLKTGKNDCQKVLSLKTMLLKTSEIKR